MQKKILFIVASFMGIIAFIHLMRLFFPFPIQVASVFVPIWISLISYLILGLISAFLLQVSKKL